MIIAAAGAALTVLVTTAMVTAFGRPALVPGIVFGAIATLIQVVADRLVTKRLAASVGEFGRGHVAGMGLRLVGIVLMTVAIVGAPALFPPLPTAFGFLGVLVPLLFMEIRLAR
ncbi:MAG TPA: hypothetical protein VFT04_06585 [Gemmatimonadales bacterium]|nr:hypothetical protein [Gemmatimonadales bacterium]